MSRVTARHVLTTLAAAVLLAGCSSGTHEPTPSPTASATPPSLGGPRPVRHPAPRRAMSSLERPVAARLAASIAGQGLTLSYLDCPHWNHRVPATMTCHGYVDGLLVPVPVRLHSEVAGAAVAFDAHLGAGVVATRRLVTMLVHRDGGRADCGDVAAYPARVGTAIVCRVQRSGRSSYVVATVRSRAGAVTVADYRAPAAGG